VDDAQRVQGAQPIAQQQDRQITGMIEIFLRQRNVEQESVVDHPEIHVGNTPVWIPESGDQERRQHAEADDQQFAAPIERHQPLERLRGIRAAYRRQNTKYNGHRFLKFHCRRGCQTT
jgi:hypothetical protein